jgi:ABC-type bacteriocin/lantibiotic exporter with double-glycine peptidase domain
MASNQPIKPFTRLANLIKLERDDIVNIYIFATISGAISLTLPLGIQAIITFLFGGIVSSSLVLLVTVIIVGVLLSGVLTYFSMVISERIQRKLFARFSLQFADLFPKIDLYTADKYYLPELVNRFFDTAALQKGVSKLLIDFPGASIQILFGLILLSFYHPIFIVFNVLIVTMLFLLIRFTFSEGLRTSIEESDYKYAVGNWLEDIARNIKTIKLNSYFQFILNRTDDLVLLYLKSRSDHFRILTIQFSGLIIFKTVITSSLLIAGTFLFLNDMINIGQFIAAEIIIIMLLSSVEKLFSMLETLYDVLTSLEKVHKLIDLEIEQQGTAKLDTASMSGISITLDEASYNYPDSVKLTISAVSTHIKEGEKVAILGTQGSGKTTLLRVISGAFGLCDGNILYNEIPYRNINLNHLRDKFSVLLSEDELVGGSILSNITMGRNEISFETVVEHANQIGLLSYIQSLPFGFDTQIESTGKKLPKSVTVKILLLRALLDNPALFIAEDYWSVLDGAEKSRIKEYLFAKYNRFTFVVSTNDIDMAKRCGKVILLKDGSIIVQGAYEEVRQHEEYKKLYEFLSL